MRSGAYPTKRFLKNHSPLQFVDYALFSKTSLQAFLRRNEKKKLVKLRFLNLPDNLLPPQSTFLIRTLKRLKVIHGSMLHETLTPDFKNFQPSEYLKTLRKSSLFLHSPQKPKFTRKFLRLRQRLLRILHDFRPHDTIQFHEYHSRHLRFQNDGQLLLLLLKQTSLYHHSDQLLERYEYLQAGDPRKHHFHRRFFHLEDDPIYLRPLQYEAQIEDALRSHPLEELFSTFQEELHTPPTPSRFSSKLHPLDSTSYLSSIENTSQYLTDDTLLRSFYVPAKIPFSRLSKRSLRKRYLRLRKGKQPLRSLLSTQYVAPNPFQLVRLTHRRAEELTLQSSLFSHSRHLSTPLFKLHRTYTQPLLHESSYPSHPSLTQHLSLLTQPRHSPPFSPFPFDSFLNLPKSPLFPRLLPPPVLHFYLQISHFYHTIHTHLERQLSSLHHSFESSFHIVFNHHFPKRLLHTILYQDTFLDRLFHRFFPTLKSNIDRVFHRFFPPSILPSSPHTVLHLPDEPLLNPHRDLLSKSTTHQDLPSKLTLPLPLDSIGTTVSHNIFLLNKNSSLSNSLYRFIHRTHPLLTLDKQWLPKNMEDMPQTILYTFLLDRLPPKHLTFPSPLKRLFSGFLSL